MRIIKWLIGIVVILAVVFFGGAMFLPKEVSVARSIEIDATPADVFPHVNSLKAGAEWSPWLGRDPEVQLSYSGPDEGVGAKLDWTSDHPQVGSGSQVISASVPNEKVTTDLDFGDMGSAVANFDLVENAGKTTVTWGSRPIWGRTQLRVGWG